MNATASAIYAHRHTVAYRLERVKELTGLDPLLSEDRERLGLGLKAYRIIAPRLASSERRRPSKVTAQRHPGFECRCTDGSPRPRSRQPWRPARSRAPTSGTSWSARRTEDQVLAKGGDDTVYRPRAARTGSTAGPGNDRVQGDGMCPPNAVRPDDCDDADDRSGDERRAARRRRRRHPARRPRQRPARRRRRDRLALRRRGQRRDRRAATDDDEIDGGTGIGQIDGGAGDDWIATGPGSDRIDARRRRRPDRDRERARPDRRRRGRRPDRRRAAAATASTAAPGATRSTPGRETTRIDVRDGERDVVRCGPGRDAVTADRRDRSAVASASTAAHAADPGTFPRPRPGALPGEEQRRDQQWQPAP